MKSAFFSIVMKHFQYLTTDYKFLVKKVEESARAPEIEGRIEFETARTFVTVSSEQWAAGAYVGRVKDDKYRYFLNPAIIYEYLVLSESDKKLVCSLDPKDDRKVKMIIHQIKLVHNKQDTASVVDDIENQLADYSKWMHQYAEPFLNGDFSQWLEIYEYKVSKNRAAYIRSGKDEFVRTMGRNKGTKESIFQSSLDYLMKLQEEYQTR